MSNRVNDHESQGPEEVIFDGSEVSQREADEVAGYVRRLEAGKPPSPNALQLLRDGFTETEARTYEQAWRKANFKKDPWLWSRTRAFFVAKYIEIVTVGATLGDRTFRRLRT